MEQEAMAVMVGNRMRIFLGDQDISHLCHSVQVDMQPHALVLTRLELLCGIEVSGGIVRLDPSLPPTVAQDEFGAPLKVRAITFGPV
jgi:hypothetical protein